MMELVLYWSSVVVFASTCSMLLTGAACLFIKSQFAEWYLQNGYVGLGVWVLAALIAAVGLA